MQIYGKRDLPIVLYGVGIRRTVRLPLCCYCCLFEQGFAPLYNVIEYIDQQCLRFFLLELKRHKEMLKENKTTTTAHQQRPSQLSLAQSLSRMLQVNQGLHKCDLEKDIRKGLQ